VSRTPGRGNGEPGRRGSTRTATDDGEDVGGGDVGELPKRRKRSRRKRKKKNSDVAADTATAKCLAQALMRIEQNSAPDTGNGGEEASPVLVKADMAQKAARRPKYKHPFIVTSVEPRFTGFSMTNSPTLYDIRLKSPDMNDFEWYVKGTRAFPKPSSLDHRCPFPTRRPVQVGYSPLRPDP
jgi:hypothetical protein